MEISKNKTLKLTNAVIKKLDITPNLNLAAEVSSMDNYIKSKGTVPVGPLVQEITSKAGMDGTPEVHLSIIRQCKDNINHIENPYKFKSILKSEDCLYTRFFDEESNMKFAYDKLALFAYENEIDLTGRTYTIFVEQVDDSIMADVFMEKKHE